MRQTERDRAVLVYHCSDAYKSMDALCALALFLSSLSLNFSLSLSGVSNRCVTVFFFFSLVTLELKHVTGLSKAGLCSCYLPTYTLPLSHTDTLPVRGQAFFWAVTAGALMKGASIIKTLPTRKVPYYHFHAGDRVLLDLKVL